VCVHDHGLTLLVVNAMSQGARLGSKLLLLQELTLVLKLTSNC
jgi:hypothetical protein